MKNIGLDVPEADVCLILEGSYPYVAGGVSSWTHDLIQMQWQLDFHLLILLAPDAKRKSNYKLPGNVTGVTEVTLQRPKKGYAKLPRSQITMGHLEPALNNLLDNGGLIDVKEIIGVLLNCKGHVGSRYLLDSHDAWDMLLRMYDCGYSTTSFLDYFWTLRGILSGLFSVLLGELPRAKVYHAVSTGYAGLYLARAKIETGRPGILTEHGIYTNERRIEIAMADWLHEDTELLSLSIDQTRHNLRDLWMNSFQSYSRACYDACDRIITLFEGNQNFQLYDGADKSRMQIIPNGIDYDLFKNIQHVDKGDQLSVALIGRVVPIKDVKTYIRAIAQVREIMPQVRGFLLGPYDEDPEYYSECLQLVESLGLEDGFEFTGRVDLTEWMGRIDLNVLTSISEAQPLVILEAGAASIPCVATNVGACKDLIEGDSSEDPPLGKGGEIVPLSNPTLTAKAIVRLLSDPVLLETSGRALKERVRVYYNKVDLKEKYRLIYDSFVNQSAISMNEGMDS